ncbi:DNA translocase FtsK, partial [Corallococcus praedator]
MDRAPSLPILAARIATARYAAGIGQREPGSMTAAKKGGRAEKAVLSRQEIATKRKALANKKMKAGGAASPARRALVGVFVLAASLLALLAVATFDAHDRVGPGFHNAVGPMGHLIAETLRGALGVCAYFVPVGGIYTAVVLFVGNRDRRRLPQIISLALLTCSVAVLSQLMFAKDKGWAHPPGGALGAGLGGLMEGMFSTVGTVILVTAISAAALIVGTQYTFFKLCSLVWAGLTVLGRRISESAHVFWEAQKVSYQARQERLAQEKEEEAAFLAELEAEEEELSEAERLAEEAEAAEAEAMAEEAVRLARQTEKEQAANAKKALKDSREREKLEKKLVREEEPEEDDDDARDEQPSLPPERAERRSPGADPAWAASFLAPQPQLPANTEGAEPPRRARKTPQIVTPPSA